MGWQLILGNYKIDLVLKTQTQILPGRFHLLFPYFVKSESDVPKRGEHSGGEVTLT